MKKKTIFYGVALFLALQTSSSYAQEAYALEENGTLTFFYDDNRKSHTDGTLYDVGTELRPTHFSKPRWCSANVEKVVFDSSFSTYTLENLSEMFSDCYNLTEIENIHNLNTSETKDMAFMFENCKNLESIDLTSLDVSKVETMWGMFYNCYGLKYVNMSGLDTKNVNDMSYMFAYTSVKEVNLTGINTSNVTTLESMFTSCQSLKDLDLSSFDTHNVTKMSTMFQFCEVLKTIYVGDGWSIDNVRDGEKMFLYCKLLVGGNGTKCAWDYFGDTGYKNAVVDTEDTPGYLTYKASSTPIDTPAEAYSVLDGGILTFYYDNNKENRTGTVYNIEAEYAGDGVFPAWQGTAFTKVVFDSSFASFQPTSTARWFHSCSAITEIEGMANLNTSQSKSMSSMFYGCKGLKNIDLSAMNTASATTMATMFYECSALESLDLSGFDTYNVTAMTAMFYGCTRLKEINVSSFDTGNVEDMQYLFFNCSQLNYLSLSNFNTSNVTNMEAMFAHCDNVVSIDISSFDTSKVKYMKTMFTYCKELRTIYACTSWSTESVSDDTSMMFWDCSKLVGGNGTKCDGIGWPNPINHTYARIDKEGTPGYFTENIPVPCVAYAVSEGGVLTFYYDTNKENRTGTVYNIEAEYVGDGNFPAWRGTSFTKVVFDSSFASYQATSTARWFHSCSAITEFEGMANLNTSQSKSMSSMFYGCKGLKNIDLSTMNTASATAMGTMFYECSALESLDLSGFDTHNVTAMTAMFYGCTGLKEINVSSFDTGNVDDMQYMFYNCSQLNNLSLSNFNTSNVTNMEAMFANCKELRTIYASELWSTESVSDDTSMMFWDCSKLVGGNGTKCDGIGWPNPINHTYARIDKEGTPGYFTEKKCDSIYDITKQEKEKNNNNAYSIDGRYAQPTKKGLYIINGKKILIH